MPGAVYKAMQWCVSLSVPILIYTQLERWHWRHPHNLYSFLKVKYSLRSGTGYQFSASEKLRLEDIQRFAVKWDTLWSFPYCFTLNHEPHGINVREVEEYTDKDYKIYKNFIYVLLLSCVVLSMVVVVWWWWRGTFQISTGGGVKLSVTQGPSFTLRSNPRITVVGCEERGWGTNLYIHTHVKLGTHPNITKALTTKDRPDGHCFNPESPHDVSEFRKFAWIWLVTKLINTWKCV